MRKTYTILLLLLFTSISGLRGQVILDENFDQGIPSTWTNDFTDSSGWYLHPTLGKNGSPCLISQSIPPTQPSGNGGEITTHRISLLPLKDPVLEFDIAIIKSDTGSPEMHIAATNFDNFGYYVPVTTINEHGDFKTNGIPVTTLHSGGIDSTEILWAHVAQSLTFHSGDDTNVIHFISRLNFRGTVLLDNIAVRGQNIDTHPIPYQQSFDDSSKLPFNWPPFSYDSLSTWALDTLYSAPGSEKNCLFFRGTQEMVKGSFYDIRGPHVHLDPSDHPKMTFNYAVDADSIKPGKLNVLYLKGGRWPWRAVFSYDLDSLHTAQLRGGLFSPTPSEWKTFEIDLPPVVFANETYVRFGLEYISDGGNTTVFIDDINLFDAPPDTTNGLSDEATASHLRLYPNPVQDHLYIHHPYGIRQGQLINSFGQVVLIQEFTYHSPQEALDLSLLAPGTYHLELILDNGERISKTIIKP